MPRSRFLPGPNRVRDLGTLALLVGGLALPADAQNVNVLTQHNDNLRTGATSRKRS